MWTCPACGGGLVRAHPVHGVYACGACRGMWADHAASLALRAADADPAFSQIARQLDEGARGSAPSGSARSCPECGAALAPTKLFGVDLDYCQAHGTFFDRGEVAKLQEAGVDGKGKALSAGAIALGVLEILSFFG